MWCLSGDESKRRCEGQSFAIDESGLPIIVERKYCVKAPLSNMNWSRLNWLAECLTSHLEPFDDCLLWVTLWGVWPSGENLHLFYRLRESYGERRLLQDAPGHLFLKHETTDLVSFVQLALLSGWDFYLLPTPASAAVFVSHDGFIKLHTDDGDAVNRLMESLPGSVVMGEAASAI